jgi:hypothetical protein
MENRLDTVAKAVVQGTTRRQALRRLGGVLTTCLILGACTETCTITCPSV